MVWCVPMDPSTTAAGCGFEHAVGLELKLSGWLADGRLCHFSGRMLCLLTLNLFFLVCDLFSRLDSIRSRHLL
ncbi:LOW QUALITY PROTEIN: hypothetical protein HID58_065467 [Brassica napus]|uniref:Uncharacterized protein n=1 Tax=Brassica napus TaxID=3708 RepID=A0ABQ7ZCZ5_BRANA|nr:LOW QUALITY PROTEIN: hypothetical protein HID58_065467 [Brassica napus]